MGGQAKENHGKRYGGVRLCGKMDASAKEKSNGEIIREQGGRQNYI